MLVASAHDHWHGQVAAGDARDRFHRVGRLAAEAAFDGAHQPEHHRRDQRANQQRADQGVDQVGAERVFHIDQEHAGGHEPVPVRHVAAIGKLALRVLGAGQTATVGREAGLGAGGAARALQDGAVDVDAIRVLELADHVALGLRQARVQDHLRLGIDDEQVAVLAEAHRAQRVLGGGLGVFLRHLALGGARRVHLDDAFAGGDQRLQALAPLAHHHGPGVEGVPGTQREQQQPHDGKRRPEFGVQCETVHGRESVGNSLGLTTPHPHSLSFR
ncbi:hypothetical protein D3C81_1177870 [compost metagenome]